ncbi:major facilitator superfamily transporter [Brucella vulpis]|nr:major facilitator superfamily transporter [Brucella vulpis]CUW48966.1 major facilitator superfamily transporter [Brucella vulpis]
MAGQLLPIAALLASTFLMLLAGGLAGILLPLRGGMEGWSTTTIGWMGTSYSLAFTIGCIFIPHLVRRVGHVRVFSALLTLLSMALLFHALVVNPAALDDLSRHCGLLPRRFLHDYRKLAERARDQ